MPKRALSQYFDAIPTPAEATALAAFCLRQADEYQQERVWNFIMTKACRVNSACFVVGDSHATAFQEGRRQVGLMIFNAARTSPQAAAALEDQNKENANG